MYMHHHSGEKWAHGTYPVNRPAWPGIIPSLRRWRTMKPKQDEGNIPYGVQATSSKKAKTKASLPSTRYLRSYPVPPKVRVRAGIFWCSLVYTYSENDSNHTRVPVCQLPRTAMCSLSDCSANDSSKIPQRRGGFLPDTFVVGPGGAPQGRYLKVEQWCTTTRWASPRNVCWSTWRSCRRGDVIVQGSAGRCLVHWNRYRLRSIHLSLL